jgi:hypothetical protein
MNQRTEVPSWAQSQTQKITEPQRNYILDLLKKKDLDDVPQDRVDSLMKSLRISEDPEEFGMGKEQASKIIEWLKMRKDKAAPLQDEFDFVPAGRYAIENDDGELRFYQVWRPKKNQNVFRVYVMFGPSQAPLHRNAANGVVRKIFNAGVRECAIRFGNEIGACSNCGRRLTNRISRELGIGPICGGRMWGEDDWKAEVTTARQSIIDRGEDPEEELE